MTPKHMDVLGNLGTAGGNAHQESGAPEAREGCGACKLCPLPGLAPEDSRWGRRHGRHGMLPRGLQRAIKNMQVVETRARTYSWKLQGHPHAAAGPRPYELSIWGSPCLQTIILKAGFPGDNFALSLRKGKRKVPHLLHMSLRLTLKAPESQGTSQVGKRRLSQSS